MAAGASGSKRLDGQPRRCRAELGLDTYGAVDGVDVFPNGSGRRDAREPGFGLVDFLPGRKRLARIRVRADSVGKVAELFWHTPPDLPRYRWGRPGLPMRLRRVEQTRLPLRR